MQDLCLQAFLPISVKLCCKGLLDMSKEIESGSWDPCKAFLHHLGCLHPVGSRALFLGMGAPLGLVWCLDSREEHGELLIKIWKPHLGALTVASCLSSFLTCIGP